MAAVSGGPVAVVTGGAAGIGEAISRALANAGFEVALWDVDLVGASKVAAGLPTPAIALEVDVTDRASVEAALVRVEAELGPVDVLVNNAGVDKIESFFESEEPTWGRVVAVNFVGAIRCCHVVVPGMVERRRGRVVNIASDAGRVGGGGVVYSGTKGALIASSKALAGEVARYGVTVNCIAPGPVETAFLQQVRDYDDRIYAMMAKAIPMRRVAVPDDIAPAVVFLASDGAGYITGQTLSVNGGLSMA
ncbi:MAG TPA: SDR family NAD(P)-dependent oxidoreductase [Iamia sp.]|nr:SDR family NAD(P)-dependent oxidoreductase [Iamia sp.]